MPKTRVVFFADAGQSPVIAWLDKLPNAARDKLAYRIQRLASMGHELRRPEADFLRDGIYELRVRRQNVNYRLLYFFHAGVGVIAHGCTKEGAVNDADIDRAVLRRKQFVVDPANFTFLSPLDE